MAERIGAKAIELESRHASLLWLNRERARRPSNPVIAAANPLRSVKGDAAYVGKVVASIKGPVVLVGHSYGGSVISAAAVGKNNVKALVYVAGFAPDAGETAAALSAKFPGSTLGAALAPPVTLEDGGEDLTSGCGREAD